MTVIWAEQSTARGTTWFETSLDGFEFWLEWNDTVGAYRFGWTKSPNGPPSGSTLGYANSAGEAQLIALNSFEQAKLRP